MVTSKVVPSFGATWTGAPTVRPVAVEPVVEMSAAVKVGALIALEKTTVKVALPVIVGSLCPTFWFTVTVGAVWSMVTVLSEDVEPAFTLPERSTIPGWL
jgi:hypothetical protein